MKAPIRFFPEPSNIITDAMVMKFYNKHTIEDNDSTYEIKIPIFRKGNLEHYLMFLIAFNEGLESMNLQNNANAFIKHYRNHTQNKARSYNTYFGCILGCICIFRSLKSLDQKLK